MAVDSLTSAVDRFAPRIQELRELARHHPGLAALSLAELAAFVKATTTRPLTDLARDEVERLIEFVHSEPAQAAGTRIVDVTALYEEAPPVLLEIDWPPHLPVIVQGASPDKSVHHDWPLARLLAEIRSLREQAAADREHVLFVAGSDRDFIAIRLDGPHRITVDYVLSTGEDPAAWPTLREEITDGGLECVLGDYFALRAGASDIDPE